MARTQVFISYASRDDNWRIKVVSHLGVVSDLITVWDDSKIGPGQKWLNKIDRAMRRARVALLLISVDFLNSDFIKKNEIPEIFRRHEQEGMTIYPLLVRFCPWKQVSWLKELQIRPVSARPVSDYGKKVEFVLTQVADEIASIARSVAKRSAKRAAKKRSRAKKDSRSRIAKKRVAGKRVTKSRARVSKKPIRKVTTRKRTSKKARPK